MAKAVTTANIIIRPDVRPTVVDPLFKGIVVVNVDGQDLSSTLSGNLSDVQSWAYELIRQLQLASSASALHEELDARRAS